MPKQQPTHRGAFRRNNRFTIVWVALASAVAAGAFDHDRGFIATRPLADRLLRTCARFQEPFCGAERIHGAPGWAIGYGAEFWHRAQYAERQKQDKTSADTASSSARNGLDFTRIVERVAHAFVQSEDAPPRVAGSSYQARLENEGLRFSPHRLDYVDPGDLGFESDDLSQISTWAQIAETRLRSGSARALVKPDPATEIRFRTIAIRRGREESLEPTSEWHVRGNTAQRRWGAGETTVVEHYESGSQGVEVSWVLLAPTPKNESVTIAAEIEGLAYTGATANGHHFSDPAGSARVLVGNALAVDAAGRREPIALQVEGRILSATVPATFLAAAVYPVAIDPIISAEFGMDQPVITRASGEQYQPAIASNGTDFLLVWSDGRNGESDIYAARVAGNGTLLRAASIPVCRAPSYQFGPSVIWNGTHYFVVWSDFRNGSQYTIYGARLDANGHVLDAEGIKICTTASHQQDPVIAWNGTAHLVAWTDNRNGNGDIYGTFVDTNGDPADPAGTPIGTGTATQYQSRAASDGSGFLVVWTDSPGGGHSDIYGAYLNGGGDVIAANIAISAASYSQLTPSVAWNGSNFLVAYEDQRDSFVQTFNCGGWGGGICSFTVIVSHIYGTFISSGGAAGATLGLVTGNNRQTAPAIGSDGSGFLLAWQNGEDGNRSHALRLDGSGAAVGGTFALSTGNSHTRAVLWGGSQYLVGWGMFSSAAGLDIYARRISAGGTLPDGSEIAVSVGPNTQSVPAAAFDGQNYLVVWSDNRNGTDLDIFGARLDGTGQILDPGGIAISTGPGNQSAPSITWSGTQYLIAWQDDRSAPNQWSVFAARVSGQGTVRDAGGIQLSPPSGSSSRPAVASLNGEFLVVWHDFQGAPGYIDVLGTRVSESGSILSPAVITISGANRDQLYPAVAAGSDQYLVVWADSRADNWDIYSARVSASGSVLDASGIAVASTANVEFQPVVAGGENGYLVTWQTYLDSAGYDVYAARVNASGTLLDAVGILVCSAPADQASPSVAWSGNSYFISWEDYRKSAPGIYDPDIFGARLDSSGGVLDPVPLVVSGTALVEAAPKIIGGHAGGFLVVYQRPDAEIGATRVKARFITFNQPPVAGPDSYSVAEDVTLNVAAPGLLGNDTDPDGDSLSISDYTLPGHGSLTLNANGSFVYVPTANYYGPDAFTYTVSDGHGGTASGTVVISIRPVNDVPSILTIPDQSIPANSSTAAIPFNVGDVETAAGSLVVTAASSNQALVPNANIVLDGAGTLTITPASGQSGSATISLTVTDGDGASTSTVFTLQVSATILASQAQLLWTVGLDDNGWPMGDGGGPNANFVQELGTNPLPGNPNSPEVDREADDDYYLAGIYTTVIAGNGNYTPVGMVSANEEAAERAFAGTDNDLRYHFNLPSTLKPTDLLTVTFDAFNLQGDQADPRYGIEVYFNGVKVQSEIIIRPDQLDTDYTTPEFTLASVNVQVGPGFDNIVSLKGINYNNDGGGNWMGIDYVQLDQVTQVTEVIRGAAVVVANPSFEADTFAVIPGYAGAENGSITGWSSCGGGINPAGGASPFADNGQVPDGNQVAFLQGPCVLSQTISGFTVGAQYYVRYRENARSCCGGSLPVLKVKVDGSVLVDQHLITPVGAGNPYHVITSAPFFARRPNLTLAFAKSSPDGGDSTILLDLVEVIPVLPVNHPPADRDRTLHVFEDNGGGQLQPTHDVDGDPITYTVVSSPSHGHVNNVGYLEYIPALNYNGPDSFTFKATDGTLESPVYTYTITVLPVNDEPDALADSFATDEDTLLKMGSPGLLGNDSDPDQGPLIKFTFEGSVLVEDADFSAGERFIGFYTFDPAVAGGDHADPALNRQYDSLNGSWEIHFPDVGYGFRGTMTSIAVGNDTATGDRYITTLLAPTSIGVPLPSGRQLDFAQLDLQDPVSGGADLLNDDSVQTTTVSLALAQVVGGRFRFEGNTQPRLAFDRLTGPLSVTQVNGEAANIHQAITLTSGAILRVNGNGSFRYDPRGRFDYLPAAATATDSFTYEVSDPEGGKSTARVSLTITAANDAPILEPIPNTDVAYGEWFRIPLAGTDIDAAENEITLGVGSVGEFPLGVGYRLNRPTGTEFTGEIFGPARQTGAFRLDVTIIDCCVDTHRLFNLTVRKAIPTLSLSVADASYDGQPHPASASAHGVFGEELGPLVITYNGSLELPIIAGTYLVVASFPGDENYEPASTEKSFIIADTVPPTISCPNITVPCSLEALVPVNYPTPAVSDNEDPAPELHYSIPSGSGFPAGTTTVTCTAVDRSGNSAATTFTVTREALAFSGFLNPLGGADATGGNAANPVRTFKMGSTIAVKFTAQCDGAPVLTGRHQLHVIEYGAANAPPIAATAQDHATEGNQFRLTSEQWHFNLDTAATGMRTGIWELIATLADGSTHSAWVRLE